MTENQKWVSHVLPHGPLKEIMPGLWQVTGSLPHGPLPRNMVIWRMSDGKLLVHSVIALDEQTMAVLSRIGEPTVMIVPNGMHRLDAAVFKDRFPGIRTIAPSASLEKVREVVPVDATCEEFLTAIGIVVHAIPGLRPFELCYQIPIESGGHALVFTDSLFNLTDLRGFYGALLRVLGSSGFFGMTRIGKWMLLRNKTAFATWLREMAAQSGLRAVFVGHGDCILDGCSQKLREAADKLG